MLAHELGHWKLGHTVFLLVGQSLVMLAQFLLFAVFRSSDHLLVEFGFHDSKPVIISLTLFMMVIGPVQSIISFCFNLLSRRCAPAACACALASVLSIFNCAGQLRVSYMHQDAIARSGPCHELPLDSSCCWSGLAQLHTWEPACRSACRPACLPLAAACWDACACPRALQQSRPACRFEYQADKFAVDHKHAEPLSEALKVLDKENKSDFVVDKLYSTYHYSHPSLAERLRAISLNAKKML